MTESYFMFRRIPEKNKNQKKKKKKPPKKKKKNPRKIERKLCCTCFFL